MVESVLIVLNYNDYKTTEVFLKNCSNIRAIDKIIVVDNFSTDNSFEVLEKYKNDKTDVVRTNSNKGYASGNNFGADYAIKKYNPKYIFIANPDVELTETVIVATKEFYENKVREGSRVGCVSCKMITTSNSNIPTAWKLPKYADCIWDNLIILSKLLRVKKYYYSEKHFSGKYSKVDVVHGSFFLISAETFRDVNYFDSDTFLYGEENILAYKLKQKEYINYILNEYEYYHHHSVSISKSIKSVRKKFDISFESRTLYLDKYLKIGKTKKIIHTITYKIGKFNYLLVSNLVHKSN
jgi:GT2 family glycosyltransferase